MKSRANGKNEKNGIDGNTTSYNSHSSHESQPQPVRILPPRGDYQTLLSYQKAEVIYEITFRFCKRFPAKGDRTVDQMVQAHAPANKTS